MTVTVRVKRPWLAAAMALTRQWWLMRWALEVE